MTTRPYSPLFLLILLAGLLPSLAGAAEIRTEVSRNPVGLNESFQIIFETEEAPDAPPDFSPLYDNFDILDQGKSQNIRMINGQFSQQIRWTLTVMAKRAGDLEIPAITFGGRQSASRTLKVFDAPPPQPGQQPAGEEVFVEMVAEPTSLYVQQQALLKVRLLRTVDITNATLSAPQPVDPAAAVVKKIGQDQEYDTTVNGRRYRVTERRYVLYPQNPGTLEIPPVVFQGEVLRPDPGNLPPFGGLFRRGQMQRRPSNPLQLEVRPPASAVTPWLPTPNLQLVEAWPGGEPKFRVGEPVTRTLMLLADGLTAAQLPPLDTKLPPGLNYYPDKPSLNDRENPDGITGVREERIAIVPTREGEFTLPAIKVQWWNTEKGTLEKARIEGRTIQVEAKATPSPAPPPPPDLAQALPAAAAQQTTPAPPPTAFSDAAPPPEQAEASPKMVQDPGLWPWVSLGLAIAWLATLLAWWMSRLRSEKEALPPSVVKRPESAKLGLNELKSACLSDKPEAAASALLLWAASRWNEAPPRSLGSLATALANSPAEAEIRALERMLYAPEADGWDGTALWKSISRLDEPERGSDEKAKDPIAPLYPR